MPSTGGVNLQINGNQITCRSSLHTRKQNNNYLVQKINEFIVRKVYTKESMNQTENDKKQCRKTKLNSSNESSSPAMAP